MLIDIGFSHQILIWIHNKSLAISRRSDYIFSMLEYKMPVRSRRRPRTRKKTKRKSFRSRRKVATRRRARKKTKRRMKGAAFAPNLRKKLVANITRLLKESSQAITTQDSDIIKKKAEEAKSIFDGNQYIFDDGDPFKDEAMERIRYLIHTGTKMKDAFDYMHTKVTDGAGDGSVHPHTAQELEDALYPRQERESWATAMGPPQATRETEATEESGAATMQESQQSRWRRCMTCRNDPFEGFDFD